MIDFKEETFHLVVLKKINYHIAVHSFIEDYAARYIKNYISMSDTPNENFEHSIFRNTFRGLTNRLQEHQRKHWNQSNQGSNILIPNSEIICTNDKKEKYTLFNLSKIDNDLYDSISRSKLCSMISLDKINENTFKIIDAFIHGKPWDEAKGRQISIEEIKSFIKDLSTKERAKLDFNPELFESKNKNTFNEIFNGNNDDSLNHLMDIINNSIREKKIPGHGFPPEFVQILSLYMHFSDEGLSDYYEFLSDNLSYIEDIINREVQKEQLNEFEKTLISEVFARQRKKHMTRIIDHDNARTNSRQRTL